MQVLSLKNVHTVTFFAISECFSIKMKLKHSKGFGKIDYYIESELEDLIFLIRYLIVQEPVFTGYILLKVKIALILQSRSR